MPKVSVIIPTYNREEFILRALNSVLKQTFTDYEIIIIDDGSQDDTKQILSPYTFMGNIKYFYQENSGISSARNRGIKESKGEYIAFLDSDDTWVPEKLALQVALMDQNRNLGLVFCKMNRKDENGRFCGTKPDKFTGTTFKELITNWGDIPTSTVLMRRECIDKVGLFDESLETMEDFELWLRIAEKYSIDVIGDKNLADYYLHSEQITKNPIQVYEGYIKLQKKLLYYYENRPTEIIIKRIAESEYVLSRIYFKQKSYKKALSLVYSSISYFPLTGLLFINNNDTYLNKILKMIKPYGYLVVCSILAALRPSKKVNKPVCNKKGKLPTVSIIVPVYNRVKYLEQAIDSILKQKFTDYEVIIVDDGSTENIKETLIKCINKAPSQIRYIRQNNKGPGGARNTGIRNAFGKYIAFLDADDEWENEFLNKSIERLRSGGYKWLDTAANRVVYNEKEEVMEHANMHMHSPGESDDLYSFLLKDDVIGMPSKVIVKKECFDEVGGFREDLRIREDWEMWLRLAKAHFKYCRITEPLYQYKVRQNSLTKTESLRGLKCTYVVLSNYAPDAFKLDPKNRVLYSEKMWNIARQTLKIRDKDPVLFFKSVFKSQLYDPSFKRVIKSFNSLKKRHD